MSHDMSTDATDGLTALWQSKSMTGATSDVVHAVLHEAIVSGILQPGHHLGEVQLAKLFHVSRTPIREAIFRLESEQFATRIPRRGLVVSNVTPQQIINVYAVRGALDGLTAALVAERPTPTIVSNLNWINSLFADAVEKNELKEMERINLQFHEAIAHAADNALLESMVKQVHLIVRRFHSTTFKWEGRAAISVEEHQRLVEAIAAGDPTLARELAEEHMAKARRIRIEMLAQESPSPVPSPVPSVG